MFGQNEGRNPKKRKNYSYLPLRLPSRLGKPVSNPSYHLLQNRLHVGYSKGSSFQYQLVNMFPICIKHLLLTRAGTGNLAYMGPDLLISSLAKHRHKCFPFPLKWGCFGRRDAPQHTGYWDDPAERTKIYFRSLSLMRKDKGELISQVTSMYHP